MNRLRALLVDFTRMPPAVMLLIIIGVAVIVRMMLTGKLSQNEKAPDIQKPAFEQKSY